MYGVANTDLNRLRSSIIDLTDRHASPTDNEDLYLIQPVA